MPDQAPRDYITKSEAASVYRRSERSLSRDITNAIKFRDDKVLQNVELQLEDDSRLAGTELTIEEIVELRDKGLNPTWLLKTTWLQKTYGRRDEPSPQSTPIRADVTTESTSPTPTALPEELPQRVAVLMVQNEALKQTNSDLRTQAQRLEKELDRRAEERREENELQKQNNVLMQQVYELLEKMQQSSGQISILPAPRRADDDGPTTVDAEMVTSQEATKPSPKSQASKPRNGGSHARPRRKQRKAATTEPANPVSAVDKYLPTFSRFFSRK